MAGRAGQLNACSAAFSLRSPASDVSEFLHGDHLERQEIPEGESHPIEFSVRLSADVGAVVKQFVIEGIHHIFIGPDHILFIIGLLLLGGVSANF